MKYAAYYFREFFSVDQTVRFFQNFRAGSALEVAFFMIYLQISVIKFLLNFFFHGRFRAPALPNVVVGRADRILVIRCPDTRDQRSSQLWASRQ